MKTAVAIVVAILVIGGGVFALTRKSSAPTTTNNTSSNSTQSTPNQSSSGSNQTSSDNTITYTDNGFEPATLTVKAGTTVTIKNTSSRAMQFDSDPHPVHTDDTELNVGTVAPGQSKTFTVTKTGTHGYHNHLNPSDTGTLVAE